MFGLGGPGYKTALNAANTANDVGAGYGADASTVNSQLLPFLTRELNNPMGYSQQQKGAMLGGAEAGAGGVAAGLNTEADLAAARNRNSGSFSGALDEAARDKGKTLSGISSGIEAKNADLQQQQQQSAASGLSNLYGTDTNAQLKAMGLIPQDVDASTKAYGTGDWMSTLNRTLGTVGSIGASFFPGGQAGQILGGLSKL
jgi:hypothetical protein